MPTPQKINIIYGSDTFDVRNFTYLLNAMISANAVGYRPVIVTNDSYYRFIAGYLAYIALSHDIVIVEGIVDDPSFKFAFYQSSAFTTEYHKYICLDYDIFLKRPFNIPACDLYVHKIFPAGSVELDKVKKDCADLPDINAMLNERKIYYGTGLIKFNNLVIIKEYIDLYTFYYHKYAAALDINRRWSLIFALEQVSLPIICEKHNLSVMSEYQNLITINNLDAEGTFMTECNIDIFSTTDNDQYCHFWGAFKSSPVLMANAKKYLLSMKPFIYHKLYPS